MTSFSEASQAVARWQKPSPIVPRAMPAADVVAWCTWMKRTGRAKSVEDIAELLGVTPATVYSMRKHGADHRSALALAALAQDLDHWEPE